MLRRASVVASSPQNTQGNRMELLVPGWGISVTRGMANKEIATSKVPITSRGGNRGIRPYPPSGGATALADGCRSR